MARVYSVPSGKTHAHKVAGTTVHEISATGVAVTGSLTTTQGVSNGTALNVGGRAFAQTADSVAITNTNSETTFTQGVFTVPANTLTAGKILRVSFGGTVPNTNSTDTLTIRLKMGGTESNTTGFALMTSAALDVTDGDVFSGSLTLVAREAPGASANCAWSGSIGIGPLTTGSMRPQAAGAMLATNADLPVKVTATWSAASASNVAYLKNFVVEVI
jgi:hypothetical protein